VTANRWWVRFGARWLARIDGVSGQLRLLFLAMTGYGIVLQTLARYGFGGYAIEFIAASGVLLVIYTYYFNEGGVRNQVSRDRQDLAHNWAGPNMRMDDPLIGAAMFAAMEGRAPTEEEFEAIEEAVDTYWRGYRDGVDIK
jgi:hypothetical protein